MPYNQFEFHRHVLSEEIKDKYFVSDHEALKCAALALVAEMTSENFRELAPRLQVLLSLHDSIVDGRAHAMMMDYINV
jgi:hypothetical protein